MVPSENHPWIARLRLRSQGLQGGGLPGPAAAVGHLLAVQAQEHAYARWSVAQRVAGETAASPVDEAFAQGRILRTHVLRPTWHYVTPADLRWLMRLSGPRVDAANASMYKQVELDARTLARARDLIAEAVAGGARTRSELTAVLRDAGLAPAGTRLAGMIMHAELTAAICSGPPRGKQHTYVAFDSVVPPGPGLEGDGALAELAWRYFSTRGPATVRDFAWWAGLRAGEARAALDLVRTRLTPHHADSRTYWFHEGVQPGPEPRVSLLPCYDELVIAYSESRDVLRTGAATFAPLGNHDGYRHVVVLDGQLLGHWRPEHGVQTRLVRPLSDAEAAALAAASERCAQFTFR